MATLLFVIFRLTGVIDVVYPNSDFIVFCQLLGVDSIAAAVLILALVLRKSKKA